MPEYRLHAQCGCAFVQETAQERAQGEAYGGAAARPFAFAHSPRHFERDRPFRIAHLALDVTLDPPKKSITAKATLSIERIDAEAKELTLDAIGFEIQDVTVDGARADFNYDGRLIYVPLTGGQAKAKVVVTYAATPRKGLYFLAPDEQVRDRPNQVWSQCQEEDARHWFPCHDKPHMKMTTDVRAVVPHGWSVLSNGDLKTSERPAEGPWIVHYAMSEPHPSYLVTLVAGEFAEIEELAGTIPLTYLVPKGREDDGRRTFKNTKEMMLHFGELTGVEYPWSRYSQVVVSDFFFGGMENTTATTMYEHILLDERAALDVSSDYLIAHELAHQWFGDFVTCRDWSEGWLNEGFAMFMEHVWREKHGGEDERDFGLKGDLDGYLSEAGGRYRRPIVCQDYDAPLDLFDRHLYEKGGLVLHALRTELGAAVFWRGVNMYLTRHARGVVETRDLMRAMEEVSGKSLGKFFEQHVYKPGHPELEVTLGWDDGVLSIAVKQTQSSADGVPSAFEVPLTLDIGSKTGVRRERVVITQRSETFALPSATRPTYVVLDADSRIVGDVKLNAPTNMLRAQLEEAKTARGRWLAALALASKDEPSVIKSLARSLADEKEFWGVRAIAASSLGKLRAREGFEALAAQTRTEHPKVRRAVAEALGCYKTAAAVEALRPLALRDASYLVEGEAARALGRTRQAGVMDTLVDLLERASWYDVVRAGAIDGLAALRDDRATAHLAARVRYGHPARVRRAAALALPKLSADRKTRETIEQLLEDADPIVRLDAVRALAELGDVKSRGPLREQLDRDLDPRVRRRIREALRDLSEGKKSGDALRDEVEKLQAEHSDLRTRLSELEARLTAQKPEVTLPRPKPEELGAAPTPPVSKKKAAPTPKKRGRR